MLPIFLSVHRYLLVTYKNSGDRIGNAGLLHGIPTYPKDFGLKSGRLVLVQLPGAVWGAFYIPGEAFSILLAIQLPANS
jgi:hypothetical protein